MASWREIERIRKDASAFRALAMRLLAHTPADILSEWETGFLTDVVNGRHTIEYTNRQGEKLLEIRDNTQVVEDVRGFNVAALLSGCKAARLDLEEDDEAWVVAMCAANARAMRRRDCGRLLRCARELNIIEDDGAGA